MTQKDYEEVCHVLFISILLNIALFIFIIYIKLKPNEKATIIIRNADTSRVVKQYNNEDTITFRTEGGDYGYPTR